MLRDGSSYQMQCEHQFGLKRRESGQFYCPVCRMEFYLTEKEAEDWKIQLNGQSQTSGAGGTEGISLTLSPLGHPQVEN